MRKLSVIFMVFFFTGVLFSAGDTLKKYDAMEPSVRQMLSDSWLDTGKAYQEAGKKANAKAAFMYANDLYPMGVSADEARGILKKDFKTAVNYVPDKQFSFYLKRGDSLSNQTGKLNNYLMAAEIKQDSGLYSKIAKIYQDMGDETTAAKYLGQ
jgi:hypothetical protein